VRSKGEWFGRRLKPSVAGSARVVKRAVEGWLWGLELNDVAAPVVAAGARRAICWCHRGPTVIRIVPPLTISRDELERGATILAEVLA